MGDTVKRILGPFSKKKPGKKNQSGLPHAVEGSVVPDEEEVGHQSSSPEQHSDSSGNLSGLFEAWAQHVPSPSNLQHWIVSSAAGSSESNSSQKDTKKTYSGGAGSKSERGSPVTPAAINERLGALGEPGAPHFSVEPGRGHGVWLEDLEINDGPVPDPHAKSIGSRFHYAGQCLPCRFVTLPDGCRNGPQCSFCHNEEHETDPNSAQRPPKGVRSGYKKSVNQVLESDMSEAEKREALKKLARRSPYLRALVRRVMPDLVDADPELNPATDDRPRTPGLQPSVTRISL
ncbi:Parkin coregulated gene protein-like [Durusdinium trenchii]|uniref:Parkin coregulated gene protein-like n=1 Tax=Durusdinium trenchii TaxID=1381693 RepID=A0ABP0SAW2_9DINO